MQTGQVENALGNDFAAICFGEGQEAARDRDKTDTADDRSIPSAQQNGLAPLEPRRICPANGLRRDVVQRGLDGQKCIGEVSLAGGGSIA